MWLVQNLNKYSTVQFIYADGFIFAILKDWNNNDRIFINTEWSVYYISQVPAMNLTKFNREIIVLLFQHKVCSCQALCLITKSQFLLLF